LSSQTGTAVAQWVGHFSKLPVVADFAGGVMRLKLETHRALLYLLVLLAGALPTTSASAAAPAEQIREAINKILQIVKDPSLRADSQKNERLERLKEVIEPQFDFTEMAKRALGGHWQQRSAEERQEFVQAFKRLLESSYVDSIDSYEGEKIDIKGEKQDKDHAEVDTRIVTRKGEEFSINYKLLSADAAWKVYDVIIEDISLVNNYRSQFARVISQSSYENLMRKLRQKENAIPVKSVKGS
jgi:phospholipid transport system substrate-binding protein